MRRAMTLAAVALAVLPLASCKRKQPDPVKEEESAVAERESKGGGALQREGKHRRVEILCEELECSKEQTLQLRELFEQAGKPLGPRGRRAPHPEANATLAEAFRGEGFEATALKSYRQQVAAISAKQDAEYETSMAKTLQQLHGLLDATQRELFAQSVRVDGLHLLSGRARMTAAMRARRPDPQRRATRLAERMCESLECSVDQENQMIDALGKLPSNGEEEPESARDALATAFAAETLDPAAVASFLAATRKASEELEGQRDVVWVEIHRALTPEQRKTLAGDIETRGTGAIGGGGGGRFRPGRRGRPQ